MRSILIGFGPFALLLTTVGCGKTGGSGVAPSEPLSFDTTKVRLQQTLPEASTSLVVSGCNPDMRLVTFDVAWARPGLPLNEARFHVERRVNTWEPGDIVEVRAWPVGEWVYANGKLKSEKAQGGDPGQWDWVKERSRMVAEATYKLPL